MPQNTLKKTALAIYDLAWRIAIPLLRRNHRLAEGFGQRTLQEGTPENADVWIQGASAGESYLAWSIVKNLASAGPLRILVTTNTSQGMGILERAIDDMSPGNSGVTVCPAYFPFDRPAIMEAAVRKIHPKVMVLLESEIWPGLLSALRRHECRILVINGRMTPKSLKRYRIWPELWRSLRPDRVLAISENDARRFASLFGKERVEVMPNIKFDQIGPPSPHAENPLGRIIAPDHPLIVLGSVRREEEPLMEKLILHVLDRTWAVVGLFPRHMHRISHWKAALDRLNIPWRLRSESETSAPLGSVILWDTFGELLPAYELATAATIGGSLVPLGGQNFLEAVTCGVIPVIGPSWENFAWVGQEIVNQGLVRVAQDWKAAANILIQTVEYPRPRQEVREAALRYVKDRQGGTERACNLISDQLISDQLPVIRETAGKD